MKTMREILSYLQRQRDHYLRLEANTLTEHMSNFYGGKADTINEVIEFMFQKDGEFRAD